MKSIAVRQAVLADLDELAQLFDQYRQFQGQTSNLTAARDFLRARFDHGESVMFDGGKWFAPAGTQWLKPDGTVTPEWT